MEEARIDLRPLRNGFRALRARKQIKTRTTVSTSTRVIDITSLPLLQSKFSPASSSMSGARVGCLVDPPPPTPPPPVDMRRSIDATAASTDRGESRCARHDRPVVGLRKATMWQVVALSEPSPAGPSLGLATATSPCSTETTCSARSETVEEQQFLTIWWVRNSQVRTDGGNNHP